MSKRTTKTTNLSVRVTPAEKVALRALARSRGLSLSEFVVTACKAFGTHVVADLQRAADFHAAMARPRPVRRGKREKPEGIGSFKAPFLNRREAASFEGVVRYVAREMHTDEMSVAILLTHLVDAIADVLTSGQVFRWPGMFAVGAYVVRKGDVAYCVPRFQANPPLKNHLRWNCDVERACNKSMDAHRRRRRPDRHGTIRSLMEATRYTIAKQDLKILEHLSYFDSAWRDSSPLHDV